ncbi:hypothetical protein [Faecalicatena contorta]|uniref:hypothetical protein n=1 Tax=Faecalicatena contorta TaxID=39482 RepID=UPI003217ABED
MQKGRDIALKVQEYFTKYRRIIIITSCIGFNLVLFTCLILLGDPVFATNDDYRMRLIVSGQFSGNPNNQAIFLNIILSTILSKLYTILPAIEWYGLFFEISTYMSIVILDYLYLKRSNSWLDFVKRWLILLCITALIFQKQILMPQFTVIAAFYMMISVTSIIEIITELKEGYYNKKYLLVIIMTIGISYCVRRNICLLLFPFVIGLLIIGMIINKDQKKLFLKMFLGILVTIGILEMTTIATNNADELKSYTAFNEARSAVVDYDGLPDYYENESFYHEIGMDYGAYIALSERTYDVSDSINTENLIKIKEYTSQINKDSESSLQKLALSFDELINAYTNRELRYALICMLLLLSYTFSKSFSKNNLLSIGVFCIIVIYVIFIVLGLILNGRIMSRIIESIILCVTGSCLILCNYAEFRTYAKPVNLIESLFQISKYALVGLTIGICLLINQWELQRNDQGLRHIITQRTNALNTLYEYAQDHPDRFYFYNAKDFIAASDYLFKDQSTNRVNMECLGNWYAKSPLYEARNNEYGFDNAIDGLLYNPNVYYVEIGNYHACIDNIAVENGKHYEWQESLLSGDLVINIYQYK